ncbi:MAG TPA: lysylphosphatidylglycerol synthase transmembrane domain-containing protein [Gemmatimonadales bacterium]|jgi:hypothetical protein|nr:lysylphosphatidylglycerol synthase transmembrane domain-containing protein [Gemmatimonadales bacterium]
MNRYVRAGAFLFGVAVLAVLVVRSNPAVLWQTLRHTGWVVGPLVALWGVVYACNARAWQLLIPKRPPAFTFRRAWLLSVSSFALNYATPFLALGGEPVKVAGATPFLGRNRAVGSVIGFRFLHALAHIAAFLIAIVPAAIYLPHTPLILGTLAVAAVLLVLAASFLLSQHRAGIFERGLTWLNRWRPLQRLAAKLEKHRPALRELDVELTAIHRGGNAAFAGALATELGGRILSSLEFAFILYGFGLGFDVVRAFLVINLSSLFTNLLFFIPFEMGAKEGSIFFIFGWLGFDPALGTTAALLSRVRELIWMALGLGCLLLLDDDARTGSREGTIRNE